jgi:sulfide:quinone oxidoreductase
MPADAFGRVYGEAHVHAIGDMTTHALKQGGLATQQADVVAADLAAAAGAPVERVSYEPALQAMLFTGGEPLYLGEGADEWPRQKIVGRHLGPYLATHSELMVAA